MVAPLRVEINAPELMPRGCSVYMVLMSDDVLKCINVSYKLHTLGCETVWPNGTFVSS